MGEADAHGADLEVYRGNYAFLLSNAFPAAALKAFLHGFRPPRTHILAAKGSVQAA